MDDDDDDDDDRSRRTNGRAPALPQILRQWATHHVGAFVEDADSSEHILSSDYDGNALGAEARRAIHEEARRRGVRAKSVDLANGTRAVALTRRANEDEDETMRMGTRRRRRRRKASPTTRTIPRRTTERTKRTRGRESWSGTLICERHRSTCTPNLRFQRTIRIPRGEARLGVSSATIKWHPDNATPTPSGTCRACGCVLQFKRWVRARSATDYVTIDACSTCFETATAPDGGGGGGDAKKTRTRFQNWSRASASSWSLWPISGRRNRRTSPRRRVGARRRCRRVVSSSVSAAFHVLKDSDRFKIYREHGYEGLVKSERYAECDVFDLDGFTMYESFFAGEDEEDRQYLLLCPEAESDDEDENDDENDDATEIDPDDEIEALMTSENVESLKNAPRKPSAVNDAADDDFQRAAARHPFSIAPPTPLRRSPWAELASRIA